MRKLTLEQGSKDWLTWRQHGIGASDSIIIMGLSPWRSRAQLLDDKVRDIRGEDPRHGRLFSAKQPDNGAMARGRRLEPIARDLYQNLTGLISEPLCCIHDTLPWMRASLDGWNEEHGILLEVKCVNKVDHQDALDGKVPKKYVPQVQHQLFVTGSKKAHYFSYSDNPLFRGEDGGALVELAADQEYQEKLVGALTLFWDEVQERLKQPAWLSG